MNKEELSDKMNEIFGLEDTVNFAKMTKEDLERLIKVVGEPSNLIKIGWKNLRGKAKKEILQELMERPILDEVLKGDEEGKNKGPLGLGVLPALRGVLRGTLGDAKEAKE